MKRMPFFLLLLVTLCQLPALRAIECEKVVTYDMDIKLDPDEKTITGSQELTWTNTGSAHTQELYFHLYPNAFKNTQSTFLKEVASRGEISDYLDTFQDGGWGYCDVISITATSDGLFKSVDLEPVFVQPDDANKEDETVFRVDLPKAIAPGQSVRLDLSFITKLPRQAPRSGYHQDYFFVAQWFPKIGVWFDGAWNCHQFHANSEFFADYGDYNVSITVPAEFVVGASGVMTDSTANADGTTTFRFQQECIHDFAWTAYPNYQVAVRDFEHADLPPVTMRLLYQPGHKRYVDDFFDATANTLKHFGVWYTPYPYSHITIVDAAWRSNSAGMEYPTLFTTSVGWLRAKGSQQPLGLTVHECGHQFFYGLIGSNEFENAWLDEGFTTYATARCMDTVYGPGSWYKTYLDRDGFGIPKSFPLAVKDQRDRFVENHRVRGPLDNMDKFSWDYVNRVSYRDNAYEKPSLMLWTLENYLGETVFADIMKTYATRWTFKHPKPQDFFDIVNEKSPENMDWFFEKMMNEPGVVDYAVSEIISESPVKVQGVFDGVERKPKTEEKNGDVYESQVHVERLGPTQIPVELLVTFENGDTVAETWDGVAPFKIFYLTSDAKIEKAEIDPYHKIWLDVNPTNNGRYREATNFTSFRWGAAWLFWLQDFFEMIAVFS